VRTTIEIKPEHRAKLFELAARRGQRGFSGIVEEALDAYLESESRREPLRHHALRLRGSLKGREVEKLRERTRAIRGSWR
jgi:hypothetical protein